VTLRRFHALWLGISVFICLGSVTAWHALALYQELAHQQDLRLRASIFALSNQMSGSPDWRSQLAQFPADVRVASLSGEAIEGASSLRPYPWPQELKDASHPTLHYSHAKGTLVRSASAQLRGHGWTRPLVLEIAEPLSRRLPSAQQMWSGALPPFFFGVALMLVMGAAGSWLSRRWTVLAAASLEAADQKDARYEGPGELRAAFDRMQQLHGDSHRWVDEQRRFLADAAHQLRTPMAVLRTQLQAALHTEADVKQTLHAMIHTVDRVTGLANQLLSVSKVEQLKRDGQLALLRLQPSVRDVVVELSPLIARKRLEFSLEGEEDMLVMGESMMLGELLLNLLANAIHHSRPGGRMGVVLRSGLPWCELVIWDEGDSIDSSVKPRLFTPFSAGKGGVGLGLSICQQLAEAMGARISLHNRMSNGQAVGVDAVVAWPSAPAGAAA
jgi:two-component system sensor histidine kinase TctE